jgi:hypothetical protein
LSWNWSWNWDLQVSLQAADVEEPVPEGQGLEGLDLVHDQVLDLAHDQEHVAGKLAGWQGEAQVQGHQNSAALSRMQPLLLKK